MNRRAPAEMFRLYVEKLRNSGLLCALFALIRNLSSRHALEPELIRDSLIVAGAIIIEMTDYSNQAMKTFPANKKALLLDMNGTFMFAEDRFDQSEDFSERYSQIGGALPAQEINETVRAAFEYLNTRYPDVNYRHRFPSVETAVREASIKTLSTEEVGRIVETFSYHELGYIPDEYAEALHKLRKKFILAAVIDIWSPKKAWLEEFERAGIIDLFDATSFSSDHGVVKPSPTPYAMVLHQLGITDMDAVVVGDSATRDLAGARSAGIDCVLVGGAYHSEALMSCRDLLELTDLIV
jgi:HAD superfamily hydrolase (TIGR01549 family)